MANYLDGMSGGKHNSDDSIASQSNKSFTVTLTFECVDSKNPLEATKKVLKWIKDGVDDMIFDVVEEETNNKFTVDLSEDDKEAVQPNND